jgi:putative peptidoglycan lipid II flippase
MGAGKAGWIMLYSLALSRLLGLLRDTFIARQFGLLSANDSYQIAILIPDLIFMLIAGGGLSSAFIPVFSDFWYTDRRKEAWKVFSVVVTVCSLIAVVLITIAWFLAPVIVARYSHGRTDVVGPAILMSRIMLPAQYAFLIGSVILATLYARKQFLGPGLAPNVYNLGIIFGAAVLPPIFGFGIVGVAWGALGGAFLGNIIIPICMLIPQKAQFRPSLDIRAPGVKKFFQLLLPVILGFSLPSMVNLVTQSFASGYGEGAITVMKYSNNLMQAPLGIFGQSFALGVFPMLSQYYAEKKQDGYRNLISKTMRTILYMCIPCSVLMFALAPMIVKIIYGYGRASHDPQQLALIASCLRIYCLTIPFWCVQPLLIRGFFSLHNTLKPVVVGTVMTGVLIGLCYLVKGLGYGVLALPWMTNFAALVLVILLFFMLEKEVGRLARRGIGMTFLKSAVASLPLGVIAYFAIDLYNPGNKVAAILWFLFLSTGFSLAYYFFTSSMKMPETHSPAVEKMVNLVKKKLLRRA